MNFSVSLRKGKCKMKKYLKSIPFWIMSVTLGIILIGMFMQHSQSGRTSIIGKEALINLDSRMRFSSYVNNSPGDGIDAEVNPPCFRWFYVMNPNKVHFPIDPYMFRFQISVSNDFNNPIVNVKTDMNVYNELAPLPEGKTYYWRVGYIPKGNTEPTEWTKIFSFNIPEGTPKWDRSVLKNPDFGGHPRLLFKKDQLPELRKIVADEPFYKSMVKVADNMTNNKWWNNWPKDASKVPEFMMYRGSTTGKKQNKLLWNLTRQLTQTAFVYLITQNEKYKNILKIWTTIAAYPKGGPASPEGMGHGYAESEDNTSITEYLACVYDWFYAKLTPAQKKVFENSLEWRLKAWMYEYHWGGSFYTNGYENPKLSRQSIFIAGHEHSWEGSMDTFPASIAMYEKSELARRYFHWMSNYLISVGELNAENGGYDDGAAYGQSHMKWLVYQLMYLKGALPSLHLGQNPLYSQFADFFIGLVPVGMQYSHFGRVSQHGAGMMHRIEIFNLLAYLTERADILYNWKNIGMRPNYRWRQWIHAAAPLEFSGTLKPVPSTKTRYVFPATGFVMVHEYNPSEKKAFKDGVGVMFCSRPNRGDEYNDENTFQMYAYGHYLNYGGHSGDENPFGFQTIAHNTIMVDGIGQTTTEQARKRGYRAVLMAYENNDDFTYWMGDATDAYSRHDEIVTGKISGNNTSWSAKTQINYDAKLFGPKGAPQLERFRRHMLFMRNKYLIIYDDLKTDPNHPSQFSWRYRVLKEDNPHYDAEKGLLTYKLGDVKVFLKQVAYPDSLQFLDLKGLDQYKNPVTGLDYLKNKWVALDMQRPDYRKNVCSDNYWFTTKNPESNFHFMVVIYPVKPGTEDPVITRLGNNTVKVEKDKETDIVSFDSNTKFPVTLKVDLNEFREPINFGD